MKKIALILLSLSLLFGEADFQKDNNNSSSTELLETIVKIPIYAIVIVGGTATLIYNGAGALIGYPFRVIERKIKEIEKEDHQ